MQIEHAEEMKALAHKFMDVLNGTKGLPIRNQAMVVAQLLGMIATGLRATGEGDREIMILVKANYEVGQEQSIEILKGMAHADAAEPRPGA